MKCVMCLKSLPHKNETYIYIPVDNVYVCGERCLVLYNRYTQNKGEKQCVESSLQEDLVPDSTQSLE